MSVLVKVIDMPQSCSECPFLSYAYNVPICSVTRQIPTYPLDETLEQALSKRMNGCPLEEVSKKKISREKFQRLVLDTCREHAEKGEDIQTLGSICADLVIGVYELPTDDVREVQHGRWIKWGSKFKCDQCHLCNQFQKPYCPNCGAKMDEVSEDE